MATTSKTEKVFIGNNDEVIELTGEALKEFEADRAQMRQKAELLEAEYQAKRDARECAIKKLAEIAGLTEEELASIL
jgi:uncharacterized protein (DUF3084 family)